MMRWRCICLLSIPCAAAAAPNATFGALADRVVWARINNTGSYDWPGSTLRHFTPVEAFDLLRGRHVLVLGNSVARHVVIALHLSSSLRAGLESELADRLRISARLATRSLAEGPEGVTPTDEILRRELDEIPTSTAVSDLGLYDLDDEPTAGA